MSLPKLTAVSTKTLSLILESQRLQTLPSYSSNGTSNGITLHYPRIQRNLSQLREGILVLEANEGSPSDATRLLRSQHERMRGMLGEEIQAEIPSLDRQTTSQLSSSESPAQAHITRQSARDSLLSQPTFAPYTDDPDQSSAQSPEPATLLQVQRLLIGEQDQRLDELSHSINRQHHISLQINDELDIHQGLLQGLESDLDSTDNRLRKARRKLDTVARGIKENGSVVGIGIIIFILLILIIRFKT